MNIIRRSNEQLLKMLGPNQRDASKNQRLNKYLVIEDVNNGKAIFNEFTRAFIWIPNFQFDQIYTTEEDYVKYLWENYFLVNEDFDEQKTTDDLKKRLRPNPESNWYLNYGHIYEFTIFTTMACNARCFYCYEKGRPQVPMKAETAREVGDYIVKAAMKNGREIQLRWFGGEPLVNENAMDIICQKVKDAGYKYSSSITTNGFLFKKEKLDKYKDLWHLRSGQVTIDGTEEVYNKTKNYKNVKGKNPYRIVLDNVKMMADWGMNISIRMNMDMYNAENIKQLIVDLEKEWNHHPKISLYCWPIFEDDDNPRTEEEKRELYKKLEEIDKVLKEHKFYHPRERAEQIRFTHCMIDHGKAVVIGTQGDLGVCEHYSETEFWGHIKDPKKRDLATIKSFQEYMEPEKICETCPIYPSCIRAKKCHDLRYCDQYIKEWHIRQAHESVNSMYWRWFNKVKKERQNKLEQQKQQIIKTEELKKEETSIETYKGIKGFFKKLKIYFGWD